ncbi:hypothetical protein D3C87_1510470 [compost metagenome]
MADVGRPSASSGTSVPVAAALLAASGPATPSIAPLPNSSGFTASLRASVYDSSVGTSAPPAGSAPIGKPNPMPRSHGFHERCQSSFVIQSEPRTASIFSCTPVKREAM